ncbi:hypothetical protein [Hydrogenophaga soli]
MKGMAFGEQERVDALVLSALLHTSVRALGALSLGLTLLAFVCRVAWSPSIGVACLFGLVLLCGLGALYFLFRLLLDERLFDQLGHGHIPSLPVLDAALTRLGLRSESLHERTWSERLCGTRSLLYRCAFLVLLQTAAALLIIFSQGVL